MQLGPRHGATPSTTALLGRDQQAKLAERWVRVLWHATHSYRYSHGSSRVWLAGPPRPLGSGSPRSRPAAPKFNHPFTLPSASLALDICRTAGSSSTGRAATSTDSKGTASRPPTPGHWEEALHEIPDVETPPIPAPRPVLDLPAATCGRKRSRSRTADVDGGTAPRASRSPAAMGWVLCFVVGNPDSLASLSSVPRRHQGREPGGASTTRGGLRLTHVPKDRDEAETRGAAAQWYIDQVFQLFSTIKARPATRSTRDRGRRRGPVAELTEKYGNVIDPLIDLGIHLRRRPR